MPQDNSRVIAVIDGNSLMHRAYHAVPDTMNMSDGTPTNAVFGFMSMFLKFVEVAEIDGIVCAFDAGKPVHRITAMERYKAQRPPMDDALRVQFPLIEELLASMNVPVVKVPGWEGDDILGTVAARDEAKGWRTLLVTGDKDAYQLVTDKTRVMTTKKGITDVTIYGPDEVKERYGVTPAQFIDFLGLKGDSADNIPGVPGIGDKTAAKLLNAYGSIDGIYENLDKLKGKQLQNLQQNKEAAFLSRDVATIVTDLDFELDLDAVAFPNYEAETVSAAFEKVGFRSHLAKVLAMAQGAVSTAALDMSEVEVLQGVDAVAALDDLLAEGPVGVSWKEDDQMSLFGTSLKVAVAGEGQVAVLEGDNVLDWLARVLRDGCVVSNDVKALLRLVYPADSGKEAKLTSQEVSALRYEDLGLAAYVRDSSSFSTKLDDLCQSYLGCMLPEEKDETAALALQARACKVLLPRLKESLEQDGSLSIYQDIDLPLLTVLAHMERTGAAIDGDRLAVLGAETVEKLTALKQRIYEAAGEEFNVDSPKQVGHILFEVLELPAKKKTSRGYSTDASVLQSLQDKHPVPGLILKYRELSKINSTYIEALPAMRGEDRLLHTNFNATVTATGRLSSSNPNLQNIPVRTDFGRQIRETFVPLHEGDVFVGADYSQIELRILAHLSGDEKLIEAFCSGEDFHAATASHVFGVPVDQVTPQMRSRAKAVNFGIVYGQQAFGLAKSLGIPFGEAKDMIDTYFQVYPGVRFFLDETVERAKKDGYASTMFGRKRHIPELKARNANQRSFGERTAMNHPMQGTAADIIKLAMVEVERRLREERMESRMILQVHDELDFTVPADELEALSAMVEDVMSHVVKLKVPLVVDVANGVNWSVAH